MVLKVPREGIWLERKLSFHSLLGSCFYFSGGGIMVSSKSSIELRELWRIWVFEAKELGLWLHPTETLYYNHLWKLSAKEWVFASGALESGVRDLANPTVLKLPVHLCPCASPTCAYFMLANFHAHILGSWTVPCPSWCSFLPQAASEHTALLSVHPPPPNLHPFPKQYDATQSGEAVIALEPKSMESILVPFLYHCTQTRSLVHTVSVPVSPLSFNSSSHLDSSSTWILLSYKSRVRV